MLRPRSHPRVLAIISAAPGDTARLEAGGHCPPALAAHRVNRSIKKLQ